MPVCQPACLHERLTVQGFDEIRERGKRSFSSLLILQSWLNWYSIGLENRHPERVSGFESLALRHIRPLSLKVRTRHEFEEFIFHSRDIEFDSHRGH